MSKYSEADMKQRAFKRVALVLRERYEETREEFKIEGTARVHTRIFEILIPDVYVSYGESVKLNGVARGSRREHIVPCKYIRDYAFRMYASNCLEIEVEKMIERLLKIAYITSDEARQVDEKYKDNMPDGWVDDETKSSITARLDEFGINLKKY